MKRKKVERLLAAARRQERARAAKRAKPKQPKQEAATPRRRAKIGPEVLAKAGPAQKAGINPFVLANHPPGVFPAGASTMAKDEAINNSLAWAAQSVLQGMFHEGIGFLGYPYLAELAQRAEYRVISETIATEATREWIRITVAAGEQKDEQVKQLKDELERLRVRDVFREATEQDGFFGRSHLYVDTGDGDKPDELKTPIGDGWNQISSSKVQKGTLQRLTNVEPVWCYPAMYNSNDPLRPDFYKPEHWYAMGKELHSSRLLTFVAREVPDLLKPAYSFGGLSMSQMAKPYVDNWLRTRQSVSDLVHAFSIMVLKTDMGEDLAMQGNELFTRIDLFNRLRDNKGLFAINKEAEEFENISAPLGTLDALQSQAQEQMCSVSRIPVVKLLGIQPDGMNATSEGELRTFEDMIAAFQNRYYRPPLRRIFGLAMLNIWGAVDPAIDFEFVPIRQSTPKEDAEIDKLKAETDQIRIDGGVLHPVEARQRVASDSDTPYQGIEVEDVPEPPAEEGEEGGGGDEPEGDEPEGGAAADHAVLPFVEGASDDFLEADHPREKGGEHAGRFTSGGGGGSGGGKQTLHAPQYGLLHGQFTASAPAAPKAPRNVGREIDTSAMKKVGGQKGSNPGGVYEGESGHRFYVKAGKTKDHVRNEMTAAALYDLAGTPTLTYHPVKGGGHVATRLEKLDKDNASKLSPAERKEAAKDFAVHAWLGNWDAVGLGGDNLGTIGGQPVPLDLGGALEYRAQGAPKGKAFGEAVTELDTLRDPGTNPDAAGVFGAMTPAEMRESARYVTAIPDEKIRGAVKANGGKPELAEKLIARRDDVADRARMFGAEGDPKDAKGTMVVPAGEEVPVKSLNGIAFKPWRPPAEWAGVEGQTELGEPEFVVPKGKTASTGVVIREPDGRVWIIQPKGAYGGYEGTFPKGGVEPGLPLQANAIKEAWEESGLQVRIIGHAGDNEGDATMTRYYHAERVGGDPSAHDGKETEGVVLAPIDKAVGFLNRDRDLAVLAHDEFTESKHPRIKGGEHSGEFAPKGGGSAAGKSFEEWQAEQKADPNKPKKTPFGGLWKVKPGASEGEELVHNVDHVLGKPTNAGSSYRSMLKFMIKGAEKHGLTSLGQKLHNKLAEALALAGKKALKEANAAKTPEESQKFVGIAKTAIAGAKKLGYMQGGTAPSLETPKPPPAPPKPPEPAIPTTLPPASAKKNMPAPTPQEIEKAKKSVALQLQFVPGAEAVQTPGGKNQAQKLIDAFNAKYEGKNVTAPDQLADKVNDFKLIGVAVGKIAEVEQSKMAEWNKQAQAEAAATAAAQKAKQKAEAKKVAEANKEVMQKLGINEDEAFGFGALVKMMGGNKTDVMNSFAAYEQEAKQYGYPITGFQAALIKNYTGSGFGPVNEALRSGSWSEAQHVYVKMVNKALMAMPRHTGVLNRGAGLTPDQQKLYVVGNVVEERAFTSTSASTGFGGNTRYKITAIGERGAHVKKLSNYKSEDEVLFSARTFFKVTKVEGKPGGNMVVHMTEMKE